jgi:hypothetical protein
MDRFVRQENVRRYLRKLETETDEGKRASILALLAEEQQKAK